MKYSLENIASIVHGNLIQYEFKTTIHQLTFDSRSSAIDSDTLFFALKTPKSNGHLYLKFAYEAGCRSFVVSDKIDETVFKDCTIISVKNTLSALQSLAAFHRKQFNIPILAITGSYGKTIVKEWLSQLIGQDKWVCKNPKSYNSQIGVPISVWQLNSNHELGIFEAGISEPDEMQKLETILQPIEGLMLNIGSVHAENFQEVEHKAEEKLTLFKNTQTLFHSADYQPLDIALSRFESSIKQKRVTWSVLGNRATLSLLKYLKQEKFTLLNYEYNGVLLDFEVPFFEIIHIENFTACLTWLLYHDFDLDTIKERAQHLRPISMRLEQKAGINSSLIINDSYSLDEDSLAIAIENLVQIAQSKKRTLILSDFAFSTPDRYKKALKILDKHRIDRILFVGNEWSKYHTEVNPKVDVLTFTDTNSLEEQISEINFFKEAILLKGARKFNFENIANLLSDKSHQTRLEIDLEALINNVNVYKSKIGNKCKLMAMVKAEGYGSGSAEISRLMEHYRVDYLGVAYPDEGINLRKNGIHLPIMVMNCAEEAFSSIIKHNLEPVIYSLDNLEKWVYFIENSGKKPVGIHLELETGMHRLGFELNELENALPIISQNNITVLSVFSHLASSDEPENKDFTLKQVANFNALISIVETQIAYPFLKHILNTAGITAYSEYSFDMVRLGIGLYGVDPSNTIQQKLMEVGSFKAKISQIKTLKPGDSVSYGRKYIVTKPTQIATITAGYADGLPRIIGHGKAEFLLNKHLVNTVGAICMDMCMIDITGIEAKVGDEVLLFGPQHSVNKMALAADTIPYEILSGIPARVKRIYINS